MTGDALRFDGVTRRFGHRTILRQIDAAVGPGESVAIVGANGTGKTTFLHLAAGLLRPSEGTVRLARHPAGSLEARRRMGFVPQEPAVYDELTPREHLDWWAGLYGIRDLDAPGCLESAGIAHAAARPAGQLSRGQRQRLTVALATCTDPAVLLLDEPFTSLDEAGAAWLEDLLQARRGTAATVLVDHDLDRARRLCDRVLVVESGQIREAP